MIKGMTLTVGLLACATVARADFVDIGGGWRAEWDDSLDPFVDVNSNGVNGDAVFIQKAAEFTQGPVNGQFPAIQITFRQIAPNAVSNIVIDDEIITNSTGVDWLGFNMEVIDGPDAAFDPVMTAASGGGGPIGWTINPFTTAAFSRNDTMLDIGGGTVTDGSIWRPGDQVDNGQLWISVNPTGSTIFTLKETPLIPAPGALALLLLGGMAPRRRRR